MNRNPPNPQFFSPPVDLLKSLYALRSQSFKNDYEFQSAVRWLFIGLHDAHTNVNTFHFHFDSFANSITILPLMQLLNFGSLFQLFLTLRVANKSLEFLNILILRSKLIGKQR